MFLTGQDSVVELGVDGRPRYEYRGAQLPLIDEAYKLDDNQTIRIATLADSLVDVEARSGVELSTVQAPLPLKWRALLRKPLALTPDGQVFRLLIAQDRLVHYSSSGMIRWERAVTGIQRVAGPLHSGSLLLSCSASPTFSRVVEMDQTGKIVWEAFAEGEVYLVQPCFGQIRVGFTSPRPTEGTGNSSAYWVKGLKSKNPIMRQKAITGLKGLGSKAGEAVPALADVLGEGDMRTRSLAVETLISLGKVSVPALLQALKDKNTLKRIDAIACLGQMKGQAATIVPALIEALKDENASVRMASVLAFQFLGAEGKPAIPLLMQSLDDRTIDKIEQITFSEAAMRALGAIGPDAKRAIPKLFILLQDKDEGLRGRAMQALAAVACGDEGVIKKLLMMLKTGKTIDVRWDAVATLRRMGPAVKVGVPALVEALNAPNGKDPQVVQGFQMEIASVLGSLGAEAKQAVPALTALLKDKTKENRFRVRVATTLGQIGPGAATALPALKEMASERDYELRDAASAAIMTILKKK
jgi:HEAT repeat protein